MIGTEDGPVEWYRVTNGAVDVIRTRREANHRLYDFRLVHQDTDAWIERVRPRWWRW